MDNDNTLLVSGKIVFEENTSSFSEGTAHIKLLDIGRQDAPAEVISKQIVKNIRYDPKQNSQIQFSLRGSLIQSQFTTYTVSVLIDLDGDGEISLGDYITMENYEVLKSNYPEKITVTVRKVV
ncbi:MAG: hypothetical protein OEQ12_03980 [Nitrosopumilus sp.]|nr:hypothetical protein [Nitrosopumilus sp.]